MRYTYLGDTLTAPELRGMQCDPVRRQDGKCVVGKMGSAQVVDGEGVRHVVLRRRLRLNAKSIQKVRLTDQEEYEPIPGFKDQEEQNDE